MHCRLPRNCGGGEGELVRKLLSEDPAHYDDAPTEGIRRILAEFDDTDTNDHDTANTSGSTNKYPRGKPVNTSRIGSIRMGTTVATNALLERDGACMAFLVTRGFQDILEIGNQGENIVVMMRTTFVMRTFVMMI